LKCALRTESKSLGTGPATMVQVVDRTDWLGRHGGECFESLETYNAHELKPFIASLYAASRDLPLRAATVFALYLRH